LARDFLQDIRLGIRTLSKSPGFTVVAIVVLALGIGAATAIFSVVSAVLLRPLPYPDPNRIVVLTTSAKGGAMGTGASPVKFNFWRAQNDSLNGPLQDISAYRFGRMNMTGVEYPRQIRSAQVTSDYFRLFGQVVTPGRPFNADEDRPGGRSVVVVSSAFWKDVLGGGAQFTGGTISLDGKPYEIVGIMESVSEAPATFNSSDAREPIDVWAPFQIDPASDDRNVYFSVAARLKPGVSVDAARVHRANLPHQRIGCRRRQLDGDHFESERAVRG
jgi:hypothetical protein